MAHHLLRGRPVRISGLLTALVFLLIGSVCGLMPRRADAVEDLTAVLRGARPIAPEPEQESDELRRRVESHINDSRRDLERPLADFILPDDEDTGEGHPLHRSWLRVHTALGGYDPGLRRGRDYLSQVTMRSGYQRVRFVGIHRFWKKYTRGMFRDMVEQDRRAAMLAGSHPAIAARRYDNALARSMGDEARDHSWWTQSPFVERRAPRTRTFGQTTPYLSGGPLVLTGSGRVRLDPSELPGLREQISRFWLSARAPGYDSSGLPRPSFRWNPSAHRVARVRMRVSPRVRVRAGVQPVREIGFRARFVIAPTGRCDITIPVKLRASWDLDDRTFKASANVVVFVF